MTPLDGPDPIRRKPQNFTVLKSREDVSERQIDILLGMLDRVSHNLTILAGVDTDSKLQIDGGVQMAMELVVTNACTRIEQILADESRWNCNDFDKAFAQILAVQKASEEFFIQQAKSSASVTLPSFTFKPTIIRANGKFFAYIGDPNTLGMSIFGEGNTPAEAIADFDASFSKAPEDHINYVLKPKPDSTDTTDTNPTE